MTYTAIGLGLLHAASPSTPIRINDGRISLLFGCVFMAQTYYRATHLSRDNLRASIPVRERSGGAHPAVLMLILRTRQY